MWQSHSDGYDDDRGPITKYYFGNIERKYNRQSFEINQRIKETAEDKRKGGRRTYSERIDEEIEDAETAKRRMEADERGAVRMREISDISSAEKLEDRAQVLKEKIPALEDSINEMRLGFGLKKIALARIEQLDQDILQKISNYLPHAKGYIHNPMAY